MNEYYFEMTDLFGGELNYCWLHRFTVKANSLKGALIKISRETGYNFRDKGIYYKASKACVGLYELDYEISTDWIDRSKKL